jgi:hypothetical protein
MFQHLNSSSIPNVAFEAALISCLGFVIQQKIDECEFISRCKGNLAVLRLITHASKGGSKENI